ncbi:hypothetical protein BH09VER1_BH09VER1_26210 [soil metagenome]
MSDPISHPPDMNAFEAAVATVLAVTNDKILSALAATPDEDLLEMHLYLGPYIRELVGLGEAGAPGVAYFRGEGVTSTDGMSLLIISEVRDELRGDRVPHGSGEDAPRRPELSRFRGSNIESPTDDK